MSRSLTAALILLCLPLVGGGQMSREALEEEGLWSPTLRSLAPALAAPQPRGRMPVTLLVIPDSGTTPEANDERLMAFDATTGDLIDPNFLSLSAGDPDVPIHAIVSPAGDTFLISDQRGDVVLEFALDGSFLGVFAPLGGADLSILENIRGMALTSADELLVSVALGTNGDSIAAFDATGAYLNNRVASGAGGLDSPYGILLESELLVGGSASDAIHRYADIGESLGVLATIHNFPQQLHRAANGNLLIANFSGDQEGIVELSPAGAVVAIHTAPGQGGYRGVFELPDGNLLVSTGSGVFEINRSGGLVDTKITGVSARFIQLVSLPQADNPPFVTAPDDVTEEATGPLTPVMLGTAMVSDDIDAGLVATPDQTGPFPVGTTIVTWGVTDSGGNFSSATQRVTIEDTTPPALTLLGAEALSIPIDGMFFDFGAEAVDLVDGDLTDQIMVTGMVDTSQLGSYMLTYRVTDAANEEATAVRTVDVEDALSTNLRITKTDGLSSVAPGGATTYLITVENTGDNDVIGARVLDVIPSGLALASWTCVADAGASCTPSGFDDIDDAMVDLPAGASVVYTLGVAVTAADGETVRNRAGVSITGAVLDEDLSDNLATDETQVGETIFADGFEAPSMPAER